MKKLLLGIAALGLAASASAQLANGSIAPDFTLKDINGNTQHLYDYLAQGKTVILDVSATWCPPCWNYHHNIHALEDLWIAHGPTGGSGVSASTTNDVMVLWINGNSSSGIAEVTGNTSQGAIVTTSENDFAHDTQGDWTANTNFPLIDTDAATTTTFMQNWGYPGYPNQYSFPTLYMICRDHIVREVGQPTAAALYTMTQQSCPNYAPSTTVDAKAVDYTDKTYFICNANPVVKFQNYSTTQTITAATIKTYSGTTLVNTYNWTGSLAPYAVASVNLPSFAGTNFMPYKYDVTVAGDSRASNNASADSLYKIYTAAGAGSIPWSESFAVANTDPATFAYSDGYTGVANDVGSSTAPMPVIGTNGQQTTALYFDFFYAAANTVSEVVLGNFNTAAATNVAIDFDYSHGGYAGGEADKLEIMVSNNCGTSWNTVWSKAGTALETGASVSTGFYRPLAATDWKHGIALLTPYKGANMIVKVKGTSGYGNMAWMDNFKVTPSLAVSNVIANNSVSLAPNPAQGAAVLTFGLTQSSDVLVQVLDAVGRVVATPVNGNFSAGQQHVTISTDNVPAGLYNVVIRTAEGTHTERLSVIK